MGAMVRIRDRDHDLLKQLSDATGESMTDVLAKAIEEYRRKHYLTGLAEDFAALRVRDADWENELEERDTWDEAIGDDLESD